MVFGLCVTIVRCLFGVKCVMVIMEKAGAVDGLRLDDSDVGFLTPWSL